MSRKTKIRMAACIGCFLFFYALFFAILYGQSRAEAYIIHWAQQAQTYGISMGQPTIQFFPPSLSVTTMDIKGKGGKPIVLRNIHVGFSIFSNTATFKAHLFEGTVEGTVIASSLSNPEILDLDIQCNTIDVPQLITALGLRQSGALIQLLKGTLNGTMTAIVPVKASNLDLKASTGTLVLAMRQGEATHSLPLLVNANLDNVKGDLELTWDKSQIALQQLFLTSPVGSVRMEGQITANTVKPLDSTLDIRSVVRVALDQLHQEFVPPRTLQALKEKEQVQMRITKTLRKPAIDIQ